MPTDRQGNPLSGAATDSAALFDRAVAAFNIYRGDPLALADAAIDVSPDFAMAHILKAWLCAVATEPAATIAAKEIVAHAKGLTLDQREASHLAALELLLGGGWNAAALALDHHNLRYPHDLVAIQVGHLLDFYRGNARDLRDRIARVLPKWSTEVPGYPVLLGMRAFGLEETGDYGRAEAAGRQAVELEPQDCWAQHAVAHVLEMQGRAADGIEWMISREPHWSGDDNFFRVHNWWHLALYHLDLGQSDRVLALYDGPIRGVPSEVALDMVDAASLLWRLELTGHSVGDRWRALADAWDQHADGRLYPFNDWHAVMAYLGAGRDAEVTRILEAFRAGAADQAREPAGPAEPAIWGREVGLPLVEGFAAFWRGDHAGAVERLHPVRFAANRFGGSHAQRDVIDWTLTEAALRGGMADVAEALAQERLALKPESPVNRAFLQRARALAAETARVA